MEIESKEILDKRALENIRWIIDNFCNGSLSEFAKRTGLGRASVSQYLQGRNLPGKEKSIAIAEAFHLNPMWIMGFDTPRKLSDLGNKYTSINLLRSITDPDAFENPDNIIGEVPIPIEQSASYYKFFAYRISNAENTPLLLPGDIVIVQRQNFADHNDLILASDPRNNAILRRVAAYAKGLTFSSYDPLIPPLVVTYDDLEKKNNLQIIGKVVEIRRTLS